MADEKECKCPKCEKSCNECDCGNCGEKGCCGKEDGEKEKK